MGDIVATIIPLAITFVVVFAIYKAIKGSVGAGKISNRGAMICASCGTRGEPKTITRGSILIEFILWCFFIVPGLIYSIWRLSSRGKGCPSCGNTGMIPVNSPIGKKIAEGGA